MPQTIHILKKDARYLSREICLFLAVVGLFGWKDYLWTEALLPIIAAYIIARLIHAEPLPGDTQFWVTRPYHWKSLLAAKVLFILILLNVPVVMARLNLLIDAGFPLSVEMKPLLWSQFLIIVGFCLPVAALAAVTPDLVAFFFSTLALLVTGFAAATVPVLRKWFVGQGITPWPDGATWVRDSMFLGILIVTAVYLLRIQYKTRRTFRSRLAAAGILLIGTIGMAMISPILAMELHTRLSSPPAFAGDIRIDIEEKPRRFALPQKDLVQVSIPMNIQGLPPDVEANVDGLRLTLEGNNGHHLEVFTVPSRNAAVSDRSFDSLAFVEPSFFAAEEQSPIRLRGSLYMTSFNGPRLTTVTLTHDPLNVGDGLQCFVNEISSQLHCRSAFRWPSLLVYAKVRNDKESIWPLISYSPFPSGIELNYLEEHQAGGPPPHSPQATIIVMEPLSHFRIDFVVEKFNLRDFARR